MNKSQAIFFSLLLQYFCIIYLYLLLYLFIGITRVGLELPKLEVRYENLTIKAKVHAGGRAIPTLWTAAINSIEVPTL